MRWSRLRSELYVLKYSMAKPGARDYWSELERQQRTSPDELEALNWSRTRRLLLYAYERVPFYLNRFKAIGLHPEDIRTPSDFAQVPVLTRDDIRAHLNDLVSRDARPRDLVPSSTGGSTGTPVTVYHERSIVRIAQRWRMLGWWGLDPGADFASVYRDVNTSWRSRLFHQAIWWPVRSVFLDAVSPDDAAIARFIEGFESIRPQLLHGYVGAVDQLATWLLARHRQVPPPKAVWVTSAPLSEVQRERIERAFGAPVYDQYGCCEVYWLAAQCPARGPLHMFHDVRRIEFLGDDFKPVSDGELGRVAITDLENRLFPLIRYMNGDMARRVPRLCSCGVTLPLMSSVLGRVTDRFFLPGGDSLSGEYLTTLFDDCVELVQRFQVRQKADYSIDLLVVPATEERPAMLALERIRERLEHKVNRAVPVSLKLVSEIPSKGGKLQYVVSEVGSRHGGPTASIPGASAIG